MAGYRAMQDRKVMAYFGHTLNIKWEMKRGGFRKIAMSAAMRAATTQVVVERALPYAISISPYDPRNRSTPHYRDSFVVRQSSTTINDLRRVSTRLFNMSDHSTEVEFLNGSRVLARTVSHLIHESVLAHLMNVYEKSQRSKFNPDQHPRGEKGRFVSNRNAKRRFTPSRNGDFVGAKSGAHLSDDERTRVWNTMVHKRNARIRAGEKVPPREVFLEEYRQALRNHHPQD